SGTHKRYTANLEYVKDALGKIELQKLTEEHVNEFNDGLADLVDEGELSQRYIYDINSVFRSCLESAVQPRGPLLFNAAKLAESVPMGKRKVRFLTHDEIVEFLRAAEGERFEHLFALMIATGLRPGEALGLPWD